MKLKIVLDTNIVISALIYGGKPQIIYESITLKMFAAYSSENAVNELLKVLKQKFEYSVERLKIVEDNFRVNFKIIPTGRVPDIISADPSDNEFLAIADSAKADFIISGDRHLLAVKKYKNIEIITPTKFLEEVLG
ncbi:MAG: putative toxin-antitoxin system toxin component, PIN family [Candidatus Berkelbacteria bacterium]|nr:putative toxin-antitoxin system toxin component, PIN family [Candidatus Berkelbacteria bacterium]